MKKLLLVVLVSFLCVNAPGFLRDESVAFAALTSFPADFPALSDTGGLGNGTLLTGFGGDLSLDQAGNRAALTRRPVILLHGNGGNALHSQWGWGTFRDFLRAAGYHDAEIWAVSYLGEDNSSVEWINAHTKNVNDVRVFVDAVRAYLDVDRVDIIGHSVGAGLARSYMLGLQSDGTFDNNDNRLDAIGTLVTLAGANYGLGTLSFSEFKTGSSWEINSHKFQGIVDDTPRGLNSTQAMISPEPSWKTVTSLDDNTITFVALTAQGDAVDAQNKDTGRLEGANLNKRYNLGSSWAAHEAIIKSEAVFNDILPYLGQSLLSIVTISPNGGAFMGSQEITLNATNDPTLIEYRLNGGDWEAYAGAFVITDATLVEARATNDAGTGPVASAYFTKAGVPVVAISPSGGTFTDAQDVTLSATNDPALIEYRLNGGGWQSYGAPFLVTTTVTVEARAVNDEGTSAIVSAIFTKVLPYETAYDTATGHYLAGRLDVSGYIEMGSKYGYINKFYLYRLHGSETWTDQEPGG